MNWNVHTLSWYNMFSVDICRPIYCIVIINSPVHLRLQKFSICEKPRWICPALIQFNGGVGPLLNQRCVYTLRIFINMIEIPTPFHDYFVRPTEAEYCDIVVGSHQFIKLSDQLTHTVLWSECLNGNQFGWIRPVLVPIQSPQCPDCGVNH